MRSGGAICRALLFLLLVCVPGVALACSCALPISLGRMREAKHAAVVRVIATGVPPGDTDSFGIALIEVLDRLKGDAVPTRLRYLCGFCCPLRVEAGTTYIVFMDAPTATFEVHMSNLVVLSPMQMYQDNARRDWRAILAGKRGLPAGFEDLQMQWLSGIPPPPPPPG